MDDRPGQCLARCLLNPDMTAPWLGDGWRVASGVLHCGPGRQRLGGLLDVFFESYWARFGSLTRVEWRCTVRGDARIALWRRDALTGAEHKLAQWQGGGAMAMAVDLAMDRQSSLQVEIDAAEGAGVSDAGWYASAAPPRAIRLGLIMTTYNREPFVRANLARLAGQMGDAQLVIVNHAAPGLAERLADAVPQGMAVRFVDQENSGGAGGARRGIAEHLVEIPGTARRSHVLIMDDDIDVPDDLVTRITAVLAWADDRVCIGGAMFDYGARTQLFSAGDVLLPNSFGIGHVLPEDGCDVADAAGIDFLARIHAPDFNGWWCFAFPLEATGSVGLPMPCFIRGDDVEYGYRLKQAGWPTLGWPGIAVWHVSFAQKAAAWQMFYDRRNSLFANAIHHRVGRVSALRKLLGGFLHHLLRYDYDRVQAMILGIASFNQGAAAMAAWDQRKHAEIVAQTQRSVARAMQALASATGSGRVDQLGRSPVRLRGLRRTMTMAARLVIDLFVPRRTDRVTQLPPGTIWRPDDSVRPAFVAIGAANGEIVEVYCHDFGATWRALWSCACVMIAMTRKFHSNIPSQYSDMEDSIVRDLQNSGQLIPFSHLRKWR